MSGVIAASDRARIAAQANARVRQPDGAAPLLTVIVPVYNEAATVNELLRRVVEVPLDMQVIVVDDGSTDGTTAILESWEGHPLVELLAHSRNRGKGAAVRTGLDHARGRFTIVQDADLEYDPADYSCLLQPLLLGAADVAYGSRYIRRDRRIDDESSGADCSRSDLTATANPRIVTPVPPWTSFRLGVCLLNVVTRLLYGIRLSDEATCYKLFRTTTLRAMCLECERFEFCAEVTGKACRLGLRIIEVPVNYRPRAICDGKKIRWRDGLESAVTLWRLRTWRDRQP